LTEWRVNVQGDQFHLETLGETLANHDPCIIREGNDYYLIGKEWNQVDDARAIRERAEEFAGILENATYLHSHDVAPLTIGGVVKIDDDGRQHYVLIPATGTYKVTVQPVRLTWTRTVSGTFPEPKHDAQEHRLVRFLRAAKINSNVRDAQKFYRKSDWFSLYKVYEIVSDDVGGKEQIASRNWISKPTLNRFTQMAQSSAGLGDDARHASRRFKPPPKPMSLLEAKEVIAKLLRCWIDSLVP
jgi:hypothetical protein